MSDIWREYLEGVAQAFNPMPLPSADQNLYWTDRQALHSDWMTVYTDIENAAEHTARRIHSALRADAMKQE